MIKRIQLAHGSGGKLMHELIEELFNKKFNNTILNKLQDAAVLNFQSTIQPINQLTKFSFTTDSYVVKPIFFPGGDIGKLAICGTINDLVVTAAKPLYISCSFIIEEGLEYESLNRITTSMQEVAKKENIEIVAGDTKVVEKNSADKLFITTSGIGVNINNYELSKEKITIGDKIIINGSIGEHEVAILLARGEFNLETNIISDCAALTELVTRIINCSSNIKFMRDPTRGGIATTLNEIVHNSNFGILIEEEKIPIREEVTSICELLGFDPIYLANEGKVIVIVAKEDAEKVLEEMRKDKLGKNSQIIGEIIDVPKQKVIMKTKIKGTRIVDMPTGEQLPRIC